MKTMLLTVGGMFLGATLITAQPVLLAGGGSPYAITPGVVLAPAETIAAPVYATTVVYTAPVYPVVTGGYCPPPNVIVFGGANRQYYSGSHPGNCYQPVYPTYSPSVIYFGRGEACQRGYAFSHYR